MKTPIDPATSLSSELVLVRADGTETRLEVRVGLPHRDRDDWACPCEIAGLEPQYPDIIGASSIQAMSLALRLVRSRLLALLEKGNRLRLPADTTPLTARLVNVWFGAE